MFLNPWMLIAVTGVAGPILIHLLNRRRIEKIPWAAMRFLEDAVKQNQRRMNFEDLLLLILRCLIVALIALAMSRPAVRSSLASMFGQSTVTAVVVIDNSASTALSDGTISRFDQSKRIAREIVSTLPHGSSAAVYLASDVLTPLIAEPTTDLALVSATIDQARRSDRSSDLLPAVNGAIDLLQRQPAIRKELYILTDDQALALRHANEIRARLADVKESVHTIFVTNAVVESFNLAVTGLALDTTQLPATGTPLSFNVRVTNTGTAIANNVNVKLSVDGKTASAQKHIEVIPPHESRSLSLTTSVAVNGFHTVTASVPHDRMPADDQRTIALRVAKQVQVLLIAEETPDQPAANNAGFFLRHALVPVPAADRAGYAIHVTTAAPQQLENAKLSAYSVVALVDIPAPSSAAAIVLKKYVTAGGGLIAFPGPKTNPDAYNELLAADLMPAKLGALRADAGGGDPSALTLQAGEYADPIVRLWSDPGAGTLTSAHFFRTYELLPIEATIKSPVTTVLRFSDRSPAIVSRRVGLGESIIFASSADTEWNDLPLHPPFVPLIHRIVGELAQHGDANLNLAVGNPYTLQTAADLIGKDATIFEPLDSGASASETQSREMSRIDLQNGVPTMKFSDTDVAGVYSVATGPNKGEPLALFAVQPDPAESDLTPASSETQKTIASVAMVMKYENGMNIAEVVSSNRTGRELWLFLGFVTVALAAGEMFLSNRFSQPK